MKILIAGVAAVTLTGSALIGTLSGTAGAADAATGQASEYVVLAGSAARTGDAAAAVRSAGGSVVETNAKVGYVVARSASAGFAADVEASPAVVGTARNRVVGVAPRQVQAPARVVEQLRGERGGRSAKHPHSTGARTEPLAGLQWDMRQIGATAKGSYARQQGSRRVVVGVIDTGIDGTHPDIAPNFDAARSRNFVTDLPDIDGECEVASCVDPADVDEDGHGTHVAGTIGAPINGIGIAGVAPKVTLVNIRAGQDSGYFFLTPTLEALTYAGDIGVDVVNMSYYTDPWLYNCLANPADSPAEQQEQKVIREATQRALDYARGHGVLPISAEGNESTDLNSPTVDETSPDYPLDTERTRTVDNSCLNVPAESGGVVTVSATGPSTRKAYYSNYGTEETDVAAPGGDVYDNPANTRDLTGAVLAPYPRSLAVLNGDIDADGVPTSPAVVRDCAGGVCGYYQYLQGTSMAAPHAAGVAALIVSEFGVKDRAVGGLTMPPKLTEGRLLRTAQQKACPQPRLYTYTRILPSGSTVTEQALCEGGPRDNGFYGRGIVDARAAVR